MTITPVRRRAGVEGLRRRGAGHPSLRPFVVRARPPGKNNRLAAVGYVWALAAVRHDPHWEAHYRARRAAGDRHVTALRKMFNNMLGRLHHCLLTGQLYDRHHAFRPAPV